MSKILNHVEDLEEKTKLIPLLQLQVQKLKNERDHLQRMLEKISTSQQFQKQNVPTAFQPQRVSPVSLNSLKIANTISKRTVSTNTTTTVWRDVGCSPAPLLKTTNQGIMTDLSLKIDDENSGKLYTEKDLLGEIEKDRLKLKKITKSVGVQSESM